MFETYKFPSKFLPQVFKSLIVLTEQSLLLHRAVSSACVALTAHADELNALDRHGGDGDCGSTLKRGAEGKINVLGFSKLRNLN